MLPSLDSGVFYKDCVVCKNTNQSKKFRIRLDGKFRRRRNNCMPCASIESKERYENNKEEITQANNIYRKNNYKDRMFCQSRATARRKGLEFNITREDIVLPKFCKYLGVELTKEVGNGVVWTNYSVDRIDSSKGYIKGNIEVISRKANSMKNMATQDELITFAKNILKMAGE